MPADQIHPVIFVLASIAAIWYLAVVSVSLLGVWVIRRRHASTHPVPDLHHPIEGVSILRPIKGIDTEFHACLSSSFLQDYPLYELIFCVDSSTDPAIPILKSLIRDYPHIDAKLLIDPPNPPHYGPNPKINNLAKGYANAKYDILWVLDSNVWVPPTTLARSVAAFHAPPSRGRKVKLVHHLPLAVSLDDSMSRAWGSKLDEMFMLTAHSKFYTAINAVAIAPCVMGKSNLYRRSDLDEAVWKKLGTAKRGIQGLGGATVNAIANTNTNPPTLTHFSQYIAEDNMIALCLWENGNGSTQITPDPAIQPLANVSLKGYWNRRVRWLRVRRYMVSAATYVEPTTECFCSAVFGTFAISVLFSSSFWSWPYFAAHIAIWCAIDYYNFHALTAFQSIQNAPSKPYFVNKYFSPYPQHSARRSLKTWLPVWICREALAFPIWLTAMCGHSIYWRNKPFRILNDLSTEEVPDH